MKKHTLQFCKKLAKSRGGHCLSESYKNIRSTMTWECYKCDTIWKTSLMAIKKNTWCPKCGIEKAAKTRRKSFKYYLSIAKNRYGEILSKEADYKNNKSKLKFKCHMCMTTWHTRAAHVSRGSWCPKCKLSKSKSENEVREIFENRFDKKFPTVRPNFLKNKATGRNLELDGYCKELKLAFEYDGEFHYKNFMNIEGTLEKIKKRDDLKDKLCKNMDIRLIRIPYTEKDNLKTYIEEVLNG